MSSVTEPAPEPIPRHIGIIMDGNGRWAANQGLPRTRGHRAGLDAAKRVVRAAEDLGVRYLSMYTFSTENWNRKEEEVSFLMNLLSSNLRKELNWYRENGVRIHHAGDLDRLPQKVRAEVLSVIEDTKHHDGIEVNLALNYGGRDEIVRAVNKWIADKGDEGTLSQEALRSYLDLPNFPDPDLIIRTGGERRTSNFLLWQGAYSEFYYSERFWPEWTAEDLYLAVSDYQKRKRNFGASR